MWPSALLWRSDKMFNRERRTNYPPTVRPGDVCHHRQRRPDLPGKMVTK
jgi:hypothetical protein